MKEILSKFPSRSAEGGEFNSRFKNDRLTIDMDSGIKFSFNFNKKYCSMFGYQLTIIVLSVWAIIVSKLRDGYRLPLRRLIAVNLLSEVSDLVLPICRCGGLCRSVALSSMTA